MDCKAKNFIYGSILNKQLENILDLDSAYKIMEKLDKMYIKSSTAMQIVCRNNLESIELKNYPNNNDFF